MQLRKLLFSPRGRVNRALFWGVGLGWWAALAVLGGIGALLAHGQAIDDPAAAMTLATVVLSLLMTAALALCVWSGFCLGIKRYHDLGKSGAWVLIQFVPLIGTLWYLVEAGFRRGTAGPNVYGPDPFAGTHVPASA